MKIKIPSIVRIGPFDFAVKEDFCLEDTGRVAEIDFVHLEIHLLETIAEAKKQESLLHEIIHGILWFTGLNTRLEKGGDDDEDFVRPFSVGLRQVIRDNSGLFEEE